LDTLGHSKKALSKKSENVPGGMKIGKMINMGGAIGRWVRSLALRATISKNPCTPRKISFPIAGCE